MTGVVSPVDTVEKAGSLAASAGLDPAVQMILMIVGLLLVLAYPLMLLVRVWQTNKASARKETVVVEGDEATYRRMKEQIDKATKDIETLVAEKNRWFEEATTLRSEVKVLKSCAETLEVLRRKLDDKDAMIAKKDEQLDDMLRKTLDMQERLHQLELRLARDEGMFCPNADGCPHRPGGEVVPSTAVPVHDEQG